MHEIRRAPVSSSGRPPIPAGARLGAAVLALGLLYDLAGHGFSAGAPPGTSASQTPLGQHAAHVIVLIGMVVVLAAIVRDGLRNHGPLRPEGSAPHAVR